MITASNSHRARRKGLGDFGEKFAAEWLQSQGFKITAKNYTSAYGEIDIIASKDNVISFVEVKARRSKYFPISQVITRTKQERLIKTAKMFSSEFDCSNHVMRFDVALILGDQDPQINYITNAFSE
ncbi:YraN family protein [bacterium]|nr:YraN family protein [bacterium]